MAQSGTATQLRRHVTEVDTDEEPTGAGVAAGWPLGASVAAAAVDGPGGPTRSTSACRWTTSGRCSGGGPNRSRPARSSGGRDWRQLDPSSSRSSACVRRAGRWRGPRSSDLACRANAVIAWAAGTDHRCGRCGQTVGRAGGAAIDVGRAATPRGRGTCGPSARPCRWLAAWRSWRAGRSSRRRRCRGRFGATRQTTPG